MNEQKDPLLLHHDADGITELDNRLPRWWLWLFVLCCVWALGYEVYFDVLHLGPGSAQAYEQEMALAAKPAPIASAEAAEVPAAPQPATDEPTLTHGKDLFLKNCLVCHGPNAQGLIGPNLCDEFFIHGPTFANEVNTITEGVPAKGMITWKLVLKPDEIQAVASYVWTLRGSNPPNPKAPEGEKAAL